MSLRRHATLTPAKIAAQRANALSSTGPRSEAGKARSRWNALRHGAYAGGRAWTDEALRAIGEDPEEFQKLRANLLAGRGPSDDPLWNLQMEELARLYWRSGRLERAWQVLVHRQSELHDRAAALASVSNDGLALLKQIEAADRSIDRKIRLLIRVRENAERRQAAAPRSVPPSGSGDSLLSSDGGPLLHCGISDDNPPAPAHKPALAGRAFAANSNPQEPSQNVHENKEAGSCVGARRAAPPEATAEAFPG